MDRASPSNVSTLPDGAPPPNLEHPPAGKEKVAPQWIEVSRPNTNPKGKQCVDVVEPTSTSQSNSMISPPSANKFAILQDIPEEDEPLIGVTEEKSTPIDLSSTSLETPLNSHTDRVKQGNGRIHKSKHKGGGPPQPPKKNKTASKGAPSGKKSTKLYME
ncbi:hypothetical protein QJS10_CPB22g00047 [Acorus calamus]|uniref:Uncharacterized protein n=1 Tax=Acorus calamus TaxID=4465 RepID=A0AAV9C0N8_ACOCL|nr:hypothetical protein QJS10_CPB22g00047 [Acorus calamus]